MSIERGTGCGGNDCSANGKHSEERSMYTSPINNRLLSELPDDELEPVRRRMSAIDLDCGAELQVAGSLPAYVYFPISTTVSLTTPLRDGSSLEVAAVGNEGMVGVSSFLSGGPALASAIVQRAGEALRLPALVLREAARQSASLRQLLLTYTQSLMADMAQTSICQRRHPLEQHMCRWLLVHLDRQDGNVLAATHDGIAQLLGVRREGVTAVALRLQNAGLIRYRRGRIEICDRRSLEARCCECYEATRHTCSLPVASPGCEEPMLRYGT